ncbi:hypothetical protein M885DRAFT_622606 [Pelagophyceae sp. CCMP2097]|nr:hypothetical protein M885DRAFT_622606 [Pelagophyceae sp. CCMP2097]
MDVHAALDALDALKGAARKTVTFFDFQQAVRGKCAALSDRELRVIFVSLDVAGKGRVDVDDALKAHGRTAAGPSAAPAAAAAASSASTEARAASSRGSDDESRQPLARYERPFDSPATPNTEALLLSETRRTGGAARAHAGSDSPTLGAPSARSDHIRQIMDRYQRKPSLPPPKMSPEEARGHLVQRMDSRANGELKRVLLSLRAGESCSGAPQDDAGEPGSRPGSAFQAATFGAFQKCLVSLRLGLGEAEARDLFDVVKSPGGSVLGLDAIVREFLPHHSTGLDSDLLRPDVRTAEQTATMRKWTAHSDETLRRARISAPVADVFQERLESLSTKTPALFHRMAAMTAPADEHAGRANGGDLDFDRFQALLVGLLAVRVSDAEAHTLFDQLDARRSGRVTLSDFCAFYKRRQGPEQSVATELRGAAEMSERGAGTEARRTAAQRALCAGTSSAQLEALLARKMIALGTKGEAVDTFTVFRKLLATAGAPATGGSATNRLMFNAFHGVVNTLLNVTAPAETARRVFDSIARGGENISFDDFAKFLASHDGPAETTLERLCDAHQAVGQAMVLRGDSRNRTFEATRPLHGADGAAEKRRPLASLSPAEVAVWLRLHGFGAWAGAFELHRVGGRDLARGVTDDQLHDAGITLGVVRQRVQAIVASARVHGVDSLGIARIAAGADQAPPPTARGDGGRLRTADTGQGRAPGSPRPGSPRPQSPASPSPPASSRRQRMPPCGGTHLVDARPASAALSTAPPSRGFGSSRGFGASRGGAAEASEDSADARLESRVIARCARLDVDGSGTVSLGELMLAVRGACGALDDAAVARFAEAVPVDADGMFAFGALPMLGLADFCAAAGVAQKSVSRIDAGDGDAAGGANACAGPAPPFSDRPQKLASLASGRPQRLPRPASAGYAVGGLAIHFDDVAAAVCSSLVRKWHVVNKALCSADVAAAKQDRRASRSGAALHDAGRRRGTVSAADFERVVDATGAKLGREQLDWITQHFGTAGDSAATLIAYPDLLKCVVLRAAKAAKASPRPGAETSRPPSRLASRHPSSAGLSPASAGFDTSQADDDVGLKLRRVAADSWLSIRRVLAQEAQPPKSHFVSARALRTVLHFHGVQLGEAEFYHLVRHRTAARHDGLVDYHAFLQDHLRGA